MFVNGSLTLAYAYGPNNGGVFDFDADINVGANFGLIVGTGEYHHFQGTLEQYNNAKEFSLYYGVGAGLLIGPNNSEGVAFGVGFGGKWMNKIPYIGPYAEQLKHKGFSFSQEVN